MRRIVDVTVPSARNAGLSRRNVNTSIAIRPAKSTTSSVARIGTETVTGAKTSARNTRTRTAAFVAKTLQNSVIDLSDRRTGRAIMGQRSTVFLLITRIDCDLVVGVRLGDELRNLLLARCGDAGPCGAVVRARGAAEAGRGP